MTSALVTAAARAPHIDFAGLSPLIALAGGGVLVLLVGIFLGRSARNTHAVAAALHADAESLDADAARVDGALRDLIARLRSA